MLFARFDWFLNLGISSTIHLLAASGWKKMSRETHFIRKWSNFLGIAIKLVLYILKQLFASVSVTSGGYLPRRSGSVNIHRYSPPLLRIIVNWHMLDIFRHLAASLFQDTNWRNKWSEVLGCGGISPGAWNPGAGYASGPERTHLLPLPSGEPLLLLGCELKVGENLGKGVIPGYCKSRDGFVEA